jgi:hypothetical protein
MKPIVVLPGSKARASNRYSGADSAGFSPMFLRILGGKN